ncbi:ABC transporter ATP-binding protein [Clostridium neuense]|uniref:ABC transporter ATP-binding protein n=1 Tax=Clostridium neuense TaxID=1728934 RepID=A0ABW8THD2_9CLOT
MKKENWVKTLLSAASFCKFKLIFSTLFAIISVFSGLVPYLGVYKILYLFLNERPDMHEVLFWSLICFFGYFIKLLFHGISTLLSHISAYTILEELRLRIAENMMQAPLGRILSETSGKLKDVVVDRVETIELPLAHLIPEGISNFLLPVAALIYLFSIDFRMALSAIVTVPIAAVAIVIVMRNFNEKYKDYMEANNYVNSVMVEYIEGIEVIKAFSQGEASYEKYVKAITSFKDYTLEWFKSTWKPMNFVSTVLPSSLFGTLPMGMYLYYKGNIDLAQFAICLILSLGIITPLMWFTTAVNDIKAIEYALHGVSEFLNLEKLPDSNETVMLKHHDLQLKNVSFSYDGKQKVLNNLNIKIPEGSFYALVGPSGGGKSTVARLIARFWDVLSGSITIGGVNIKEIPLNELNGMISFVTQDNFLFDCSLLENIRLGNPNATDKEVYKAAKLAQCEEFINNLPNGYNTTAGEAGGRLSGGERQRIAIARAMLKNAPIVILDEATAFTDTENEDKIQASISALTKGKTLIIIAHRLSTIKNADKIVVLKDGKIEQSGKQQELLNSCKLYKEMWQRHIGAKNWAAGKGREYV